MDKLCQSTTTERDISFILDESDIVPIDVVDVQDMDELAKYMTRFEDCSMNDTILALMANIAAYNANL